MIVRPFLFKLYSAGSPSPLNRDCETVEESVASKRNSSLVRPRLVVFRAELALPKWIEVQLAKKET